MPELHRARAPLGTTPGLAYLPRVFQYTRTVQCPRCGASTPLPEDLLTKEFACAYCHHALATVDFAGAAAVSADALVDHIERAVASPGSVVDAARAAPKFQGDNAEVRASACVHCLAPVEVPMDLTINFITCGACGREQAIERHVSQKERLEADMERQVAGNRALDAFYADGVSCTSCGGHVTFPDDGSVQIACPHCQTTLVASQWVDASAVARRRLKHAVFAMRDELVEQQRTKDRSTAIAILVVVGLVVAFAVAMQLASGG